MALLLAQATDGHEGRCRADRPALRLEVGRRQTAVNHVDVVAPVGRSQPKQLRAAVGTDADHERGVLDLVGERQPDLTIELLRTVHGEAVRGPAEHATEHRDRGRVGAEVGVQVIDPALDQQLPKACGFGHVGRPIGR